MNVSIIIGGNEIMLSDGSFARLLNYDDLGLPELNRLSTRGPMQHGDTDLGFRQEPRFPTLSLSLVGTNKADLDSRRKRLANLFKPGQNPYILRFYLDDGTIRQIDCYYQGGMKMPSVDKPHRLSQKIGVISKAPDPMFYDPIAKSITFQLGGGGGSWEFPMSVPWTVGGSSINQSISENYAGTAPAFPHLIRIVGPITKPVITNTTTGEKLEFVDGVDVNAGDYVDIDLRYGYKTVIGSNGVYRGSDLTDDSDLATWHLEPPDGDAEYRSEERRVGKECRSRWSPYH